MTEFVYMTIRTLDVLRKNGEAETVQQQVARYPLGASFCRMSGSRSRFVITVPKGMLADGDMITDPTPEIKAWVMKCPWMVAKDFPDPRPDFDE